MQRGLSVNCSHNALHITILETLALLGLIFPLASDTLFLILTYNLPKTVQRNHYAAKIRTEYNPGGNAESGYPSNFCKIH